MQLLVSRRVTVFIALLMFSVVSTVCAGPADSVARFDPQSIRAVMKRVADWQLVNPSASSNRYTEDAWTWGACYAGMMAWSRIAEDAKYHDAMLAMGRRFDWKPAKRIYDADDHVVAQTYLELFLRHRDPVMLKPTQERFDFILSQPATNSLEFRSKDARNRWAWCDALFMGPPTWARLFTATGDGRYLDFMTREWWATTDHLYDKEEQLYFRDSTFFEKREANGRKIFWSRGNGWVLAGLARVLQHLPEEHPDRERFENHFRDMAQKVLSCQQADGLWRASLLDPASYPLKETSGSAFFLYAFAWGVNEGLLERAKFEPAIRRGWSALVECVTPDGKLTHVQPVGADPKKFDENSSDVYGVGAFLLAGSEIYRLERTVDLFNGKDFAGWTFFMRSNAAPEQTWSVSNGVIRCVGRPPGYMRTEKSFRDYRLTIEWRFVRVGPRADNTGILLNMQLPDKIWPPAIECQGQSGRHGDFWLQPVVTAKEYAGDGKKAIHVPMSFPANEKPVGGWNVYGIVVRGDSVEAWVNGKFMNKVSKCSVNSGFIGIQSEGAEFEVRRVRLEPLGAE